MVPTAPSLPLALRPVNAARLLGVSPRTLWEWTRAGLIPSVRIGTGKIDRVGEKRVFVKRKVQFERRPMGEAGLGEQQIAAAGAAADRKVAGIGGDIGGSKQSGDLVRHNAFLAGGKSRLLAAGRINHVAAEQQYLAGRGVGLILGIHINLPAGVSPFRAHPMQAR